MTAGCRDRTAYLEHDQRSQQVAILSKRFERVVAEANAPELRNAVLRVQKKRNELSEQSFLLRGKVAQAGDYAEIFFRLEFARDGDFRNLRRAASHLHNGDGLPTRVVAEEQRELTLGVVVGFCSDQEQHRRVVGETSQCL